MTGVIKKQFILLLIVLFIGLFFTNKANASLNLSNASDTITTSRPSASAPLNTDQAASATQVAVVDNGSMYLASDSAVLQFDTGQTENIVNVASMSAQITGTPNTRNIYFTSTVTNAHHKGTAVVVPVTATHTIKFTTASNIPASGHIIITFPVPSSNANIASPSATGFSFNGMAASSPTDVKFNNATCTSVTVTAATGTIDCVLTSGIAGATTVTVLVGCTTGTTACTVFAPRLINPTKTAAAGTADSWKINIKTQDNSSIDLDTAKVVVGTVEAVQVQGTVDAFLTFSIAGKINGASACGDTTNPGTGLNATATFVNLGALVSSAINISAQTLTVDTNGAAGYSIIATSSGRFINPPAGFWLPDANTGNGLTANNTPAPAAITAGTPKFGIHPCSVAGTYAPTVSTGVWGPGGGGSNNYYSNPWNTGTNGFYASISSYGAPAATSQTDVEYAATISPTTPAGIYSNYFTYVATPIF